MVKLNHYTFLLFHNGNSTKLEIQSFGTLANLNVHIKLFFLTSVVVLLQWASRSDDCLYYFKRWDWQAGLEELASQAQRGRPRAFGPLTLNP